MSDAFRSISLPELQDRAEHLLSLVLDETGRLTVDVGGRDEVVVISKRELDSLERALALLVKDSEAEQLCRQVARDARSICPSLTTAR